MIPEDQCPLCGTWRCHQCPAVRKRANRYSVEPQTCGRCGSPDGVMVPVVHYNTDTKAEHIESAAEMDWEREPRYPLYGRKVVL